MFYHYITIAYVYSFDMNFGFNSNYYYFQSLPIYNDALLLLQFQGFLVKI